MSKKSHKKRTMPRKPAPGNSLLEKNPEVAAQWDMDAPDNLGLGPADVSHHSAFKASWVCEKEHRWTVAVSNRSGGTGCPVCANSSGGSPISTEILAEWDYDANGDLDPNDFSSGSDYQPVWKCKKGHQWRARIRIRVRNKSQCPDCSYSSRGAGPLTPEMVMLWDRSANGRLRPDSVSLKSNKKIHWKCPKGHKWVSTPDAQSKKNGCVKCNGRTPSKSAGKGIHHDLIAEWDYEVNGDLRPEDVTAMSSRSVGWICSEGHRWTRTVSSRTRMHNNGKNVGCPMCRNAQSNMSHELLEQWDWVRNGDLDPMSLTEFSHEKVFWICDKGHSWKAAVSSRSNGNGCPGCISDQGPGPLTPELLAEWDYDANGDVDPSAITMGYRMTAHWVCAEGHKWAAPIYSRSAGFDCPKCLKGRGAGPLSPRLVAEWDYDANGDLRPEDVTAGSNMKVHWVCRKGHKWVTTPNSRRNSGCAFCFALDR